MSKPRRELFAAYGVSSVVPRWAMSAITDDGCQLVLCCWEHKFGECGNRRMPYEYQLSHWTNASGANRCREHLETAVRCDMPVRLIVATAKSKKDQDEIDRGSATDAKVTFHSMPTHIGRVTSFDGDVFSVLFERPEG